MEDRLLKYFPEQIQSNKRIIAGFQDDLAMRETNPSPHEGFVGMEVGGNRFSEKEDAWKAILEACETVKDLQTLEIGKYWGFTMSLSVQNFGLDYVLSLKGEMAHAVTLGTDPRGNILRIDNMLSAMEERIQQTQEQLGAARQEVGRPFPQEDELRQKGTRLAEVDAQVNLGGEQVVETASLRAAGDEQLEYATHFVDAKRTAEIKGIAQAATEKTKTE